MCSRSNIKYFNTITGEFFSHGCHAYICPECGKRKIFRLRKALEAEFQSWKNITFWTYTINTSLAISQHDHYSLLSECFNIMITYLRRSSFVKDSHFKYIRINEYHKSGYAHIHVCINIYIPVRQCIAIWQSIVSKQCTLHGIYHNRYKVAGVYVRGSGSATRAAQYLTKYITKSLKHFVNNRIFKRHYSKSNNIILFPNRLRLENPKDWVIVFYSASSSKVLIGLEAISTSPHIQLLFIELFGLPPPILRQITELYHAEKHLFASLVHPYEKKAKETW